MYKNLFLAAAGLLVAGSMNAANPSVVIVGFDAATPVEETVSSTHTTVNIAFSGATVKTGGGITVNGISSWSGNYLEIAKSGTVTVTRPAVANDAILDVKLICSAKSSHADVLMEWSKFTSPTSFKDEGWESFNVANLSFMGDVAAEVSPIDYYYGTGSGKTFADLAEEGTTDPEAIQIYRFTVPSKSADELNLYGIKIYTDPTPISTGLQALIAAKTPVKSSYYDLTGKIVSPDAKGFVIRKITYSDGSVANEKAYNR
jgi:hypothetical protein